MLRKHQRCFASGKGKTGFVCNNHWSRNTNHVAVHYHSASWLASVPQWALFERQIRQEARGPAQLITVCINEAFATLSSFSSLSFFLFFPPSIAEHPQKRDSFVAPCVSHTYRWRGFFGLCVSARHLILFFIFLLCLSFYFPCPYSRAFLAVDSFVYHAFTYRQIMRSFWFLRISQASASLSHFSSLSFCLSVYFPLPPLRSISSSIETHLCTMHFTYIQLIHLCTMYLHTYSWRGFFGLYSGLDSLLQKPWILFLSLSNTVVLSLPLNHIFFKPVIASFLFILFWCTSRPCIIIIIIIIDNFCIALFSGVPKLTALYILQHFLSCVCM